MPPSTQLSRSLRQYLVHNLRRSAMAQCCAKRASSPRSPSGATRRAPEWASVSQHRIEGHTSTRQNNARDRTETSTAPAACSAPAPCRCAISAGPRWRRSRDRRRTRAQISSAKNVRPRPHRTSGEHVRAARGSGDLCRRSPPAHRDRFGREYVSVPSIEGPPMGDRSPLRSAAG